MTQVVDFAGPSDSMVHVTHSDRATLMSEVEAAVQAGEGFSMATLNLDHIVKLRRDPTFLAAYKAQTYVVADGNPIVWLSRQAGREVELIPGSELVVPLSQMAGRLNVPVAFLGSTVETLDAAEQGLRARCPGLNVVCKIAPPYGFDPDGDVAVAALKEVASSGAGLCFLALGAPKQERLAVRGHALAPKCGFVSIGAGLDFVAGAQKRAPVWVRKLALEWVWRMLGNPGRLAGRYMACIAIMPGLFRSARQAGKAFTAR
ncbi:WecB/TagA/CpsF family glycosyltransferase [Tateyamaria sp. ANG-S1]|uniref:WecB/TagA/CpsF family glycosyltransferase n=1 Tax=Tateyamaria sp. ANG-S1 TaxID=1577905 RepID=UPI00057FC07C|nr:WecB/TagA/CpsF family glycosyltransferase [Tateyamaria sp. ANG-S1]KIC45457.1 glycosyl transferase [Tateyamaria sp. ANG-S1]